jgi:hypothetical protein
MTRKLHVIPIGDVDIHAAQECCWCSPSQNPDETAVWRHNAKDCREKRERQGIEAEPGNGWVIIAEYIAPNDRVERPRQ